MTYRLFDTATWDDPWFDDLDNDCKLLFIYLWTNQHCNQAGMYTISKRLIEAHSNVNSDCIDKLAPKVVYYKRERIVWIKNFFKYQCQNSNFAKAAINAIKNFPTAVINDFLEHNAKSLKSHGLKIQYRKGTDTPSYSTVKDSKGQYSKEETLTYANTTCPQCNSKKRESWHDLCDKCYKSKVARPYNYKRCPYCGIEQSYLRVDEKQQGCNMCKPDLID